MRPILVLTPLLFIACPLIESTIIEEPPVAKLNHLHSLFTSNTTGSLHAITDDHTSPRVFSSSFWDFRSSTTTTTASPDVSYYDGDSISNSWRNGRQNFDRRGKGGCPPFRSALPNGHIRIKSTSRMVRFSCNDGFDLVGNRYTTCVRGRWNRDLPVCVSSGCPRIVSGAPLKVKRLFQGNVIDLSCALGYNLNVNISLKASGSSSASTSDRDSNELMPASQTVSSYPFASLRLYCVSKTWRMDDPNTDIASIVVNRVPVVGTPTCEIYEAPVLSSMNCTFEDTLCGWFQDKDDDFDWMRNRHTTPSHLDGTGPSFDHTFGPNGSGYYLYMEASYPRVPDEVARLYSPVYTHLEGTSDACFQFYYHMYGRAIGTLRVYVLEKFQVLKELIPKVELVGDQGDVWSKAQLEINAPRGQHLRPFQIVFEGIQGHGHQGDIAIDDLLLTLGQNCTNYNSSLELAPDLVADIAAEMANVTSANTSDAPRAEAWSSTTAATSAGSSSTIEATASTTSTRSILPKRNGTSLLKPVIDWWKRPKSTTAASTVLSSNTVTSSLSSSTSIQPTVDAVLTKATPLPTDWEKKLQEKMKQATEKAKEKNVPLLIEFHNSTQATTGAEVTTESPVTTVAPLLVSTTTVNASSASTAHQSSLSSSISTSHGQPSKSAGRRSTASVYLSSLSLFALLLIVVCTVYIAYVYRPAHLNRSNLDQFVASFVRRCKGLGGRPVEEADDAELLMMANNNGDSSGVLVINGDLHAYDNAHMNEGVVYLHSANEKY